MRISSQRDTKIFLFFFINIKNLFPQKSWACCPAMSNVLYPVNSWSRILGNHSLHNISGYSDSKACNKLGWFLGKSSQAAENSAAIFLAECIGDALCWAFYISPASSIIGFIARLLPSYSNTSEGVLWYMKPQYFTEILFWSISWCYLLTQLLQFFLTLVQAWRWPISALSFWCL